MNGGGIGVHVYWASLASLGGDEAIDHLPPADLTRLATLRDANRRRQFLAGRGLLRYALQDRYGAIGANWAVDLEGDKPVLRVDGGAPSISLSHTHELVVCALADVPLGMDAEFRRPRDFYALAEFICGPEEWRVFLGLDAEQRELAFYRLWSAKEAAYKLQGGELYPEVCAGLDPSGDLPADWSVEAAPAPFRMAWLPLPQGYVGAVAVRSATPLRLTMHADVG